MIRNIDILRSIEIYMQRNTTEPSSIIPCRNRHSDIEERNQAISVACVGVILAATERELRLFLYVYARVERTVGNGH
jgi:hypothetical protein